MGCQENFRERDGWKPRPGPFGSASEGTPAGSVPWADRPVKPESHERGRRAESAIGSKEELEAARHAAKRQAAPFSKGAPRASPRQPGRKPGRAYGPRDRLHVRVGRCRRCGRRARRRSRGARRGRRECPDRLRRVRLLPDRHAQRGGRLRGRGRRQVAHTWPMRFWSVGG